MAKISSKKVRLKILQAKKLKLILKAQSIISMADLLIKDGYLVFPDITVRSSIYSEDGIIKSIGSSVPNTADVVIDAFEKYVLPGAIDEHVHCRDPGLTYKEDFETCTKSAAAGGVTAIFDMPNNIPPVDDAVKLREKAEIIASKAHVDFALYGVIHGSNTDKFEEMLEAGAIGFKVYLAHSTGNIQPPGDGAIVETLTKSAKTNSVVVFHAENDSIIEFYTKKLIQNGRKDPKAHMEARPALAEEEAIRRVSLFAERTGARVLIAHVSSASGLSALKEARDRGSKIYGETCPHYLLLDESDYEKYGNMIKINPPVRTASDKEALWKGIENGTITNIGSDHAPHLLEEKSKGVWESASGIIGVQTIYPLMLNEALKGRISINAIVGLLSENPAKLFGIYGKKGNISVNADADFVLFDPLATFKINEDWIYSKGKNSPFIGWELKGKIIKTILRGKEIYDGEKVVEKTGKQLKSSNIEFKSI